jgi:hypothetical protein
VEIHRPGKVLFPGDGLTKADLLTYHRSAAPFMLPYLRGRPLMPLAGVWTPCAERVGGERFRAPGFAGPRGGNPHAVMANTSETLRRASEQLTELTGMEAESVSSFQRTEDGWTLTVEVLELARVPDTMSLLASYEVQVDQEGELVGYRRVRRYERGRADRSR